MTANRYQRALPGESMKSRAVALEPTRGSAFGQKSLSAELTRHGEGPVAAGDVTRTVTKSPGVTPVTAALK